MATPITPDYRKLHDAISSGLEAYSKTLRGNFLFRFFTSDTERLRVSRMQSYISKLDLKDPADQQALLLTVLAIQEMGSFAMRKHVETKMDGLVYGLFNLKPAQRLGFPFNAMTSLSDLKVPLKEKLGKIDFKTRIKNLWNYFSDKKPDVKMKKPTVSFRLG